MYFSKSKYCDLCQCGKIPWLKEHKNEELVESDFLKGLFASGNDVGDLAKRYFGDFVEVTVLKEDGKTRDLAKMIENTDAEMAKNTPAICEASFSYGGLYCAVDILRREGEGWSIYEVKSSTDNSKDVYMHDIAYQKYVLENCGVNVTGTYLMNIDNSYVFDGTLDIHKLFKVTDVADKVAQKLPEVKGNLERAEKIMASDTEPDIDIGAHCSKPYECGFQRYCRRALPEANVFELYRINSKTAQEFYRSGVVSYADLEKSGSIKNATQKMQIDHYLYNKAPFVDKEKLREYLDRLTYPLYFLDFETFSTAVPMYAGTKPYAAIPFQYSLHYIESESGELRHKEFLAKEGTDPLRPVAEALCRDIPRDVVTLAYNKQFECMTLNLLAKLFPDLSEHLLNIRANVVDLIEPFRNLWYFNRGMCLKGDADTIFSIKNVLPSMFPDDPELDYHNLEGIHNGGEAMNAFPAMAKMSPEEIEQTRKNLLKYCELDTLAMVKVWQALRKAAE